MTSKTKTDPVEMQAARSQYQEIAQSGAGPNLVGPALTAYTQADEAVRAFQALQCTEVPRNLLPTPVSARRW